MGPGHGSQECLLAWHHAPAAGAEEPETVVEGGCDALRRQAPYPGRRELESQRNAVQALADLGHGRGVLVGYAEVRIGLHRPLDEQPDGIGVAHSLWRFAGGRRQTQ